MSEYKFDSNLPDERAVLDYFIDAINYRNSHKDQSTDIAMQVFNRTHVSKLSFELSADMERLRYEFGALEAPGSPEDAAQTLEDYDDMLWDRWLELAKRKRGSLEGYPRTRFAR